MLWYILECATYQNGGGLIGEKKYINFDDDTVDKNFLDNILKIKYKPGTIYTRKIKKFIRAIQP